MIVIQTSIPFHPDRREEVRSIVEKMVERSRAEDGALDYHAAIDVFDPNVVRFTERYEDAAAAEAHQRTDHYRAFVEALPELVDGELHAIQFEPDGEPHESRFDAELAVQTLPDDE